MNVIAVMAAYERQMVTRDAVRALKRNGVDDIVMVGSGGQEKRVAKSEKVKYMDRDNYPLGAKWQAGIDAAISMGADIIVTCGSDDILTDNYVQCGIDLMGETGAVLVGKSSWFMVNLVPGEEPDMRWCWYNQRYDPIGAGRIYNTRLLRDKAVALFPIDEDFGLDGASYRRILAIDGSVELMNDLDCWCLSIKGQWEMKDSFGSIASNVNNKGVDHEKFFEQHLKSLDWKRYLRKR